MKLRSFFSALSGVVVLLLLLGAAGAYWLTAQSSAQLPPQATPHPTAAMFVSRQSSAMVSLLVNPDRLESFWLAESSPAKRRELQTNLNQLQQSLFANTGLDYNRDLKSWLGNEVTFAVTTPDVDRDASNGVQPGYLWVLTTDNPQLAQESVQAFWQRRATAKDLVLEQFAGVQLIHAASKKAAGSQPNLTSAVVGDRYVLFANYPKVLRDALNNVQVPDLSLDRSFTYQQALEKFSDRQLGIVFVNLAQSGTWFKSQSPDLPAGITESSPYDGLIAALKPVPQGLLADTFLLTTTPDAQPLQRATITDISNIVKFIPSSSTLAITGQDLQQTWNDWQNSWGTNPFGTSLQQTLATLQQQWDIPFPEALSWVTGNYALAQLPPVGRSQPDWIFVAQQSPESSQGVSQLDQLAQQQGISLGSFLLGEQKIYAWTKLTPTSPGINKPGSTALQAKIQGVHTTIGDYEVFATSLEAMEQALAAQTAAPPADLQTAIAQLQTPNQGYLFLNQASLDQLLQAIRGGEGIKKQLASNLRSAVISSYGTDETGLRGAVFLHLNGI